MIRRLVPLLAAAAQLVLPALGGVIVCNDTNPCNGTITLDSNTDASLECQTAGSCNGVTIEGTGSVTCMVADACGFDNGLDDSDKTIINSADITLVCENDDACSSVKVTVTTKDCANGQGWTDKGTYKCCKTGQHLYVKNKTATCLNCDEGFYFDGSECKRCPVNSISIAIPDDGTPDEAPVETKCLCQKNHYFVSGNPPTCTSCDIGIKNSESAESAGNQKLEDRCLCPTNTYFNATTDVCMGCPVFSGTAEDVADPLSREGIDVKCKCKETYYNKNGGPNPESTDLECEQCQGNSVTKDEYSNQGQQERCLCKPGYYSLVDQLAGTTSCNQCQVNSESTTGDINRPQDKRCLCKENYYYDFSGECKECQQNSGSTDDNSQNLNQKKKCQCNNNFYYSEKDFEKTCKQCPDGTTAGGGTNEEGPSKQCLCDNEKAAVLTENTDENGEKTVSCKCKQDAYGTSSDQCELCTENGEIPIIGLDPGFGARTDRCSCADSQREEREDGGDCVCKPGYFSDELAKAGQCEPCGRDELPALEANGFDVVGLGRGAKDKRCRCGIKSKSVNDDWVQDTTCTTVSPAIVPPTAVALDRLPEPLSLASLQGLTAAASRESVAAALVACAASTVAAALAV